MRTSLVYVTGNPDKAKQTACYCRIPLRHIQFDLTEIQSLDSKEIIEHKAKQAYQHVRSPVLVEDTSLTFISMGRLPGTLIKWFLEELGTSGLCRLLDNYKDRSAIAKATYGLYDGTRLKIFEGSVKGKIAEVPRGIAWGWNPIFIPDRETKTWGEMDEEERRRTSIRKIALKKLEKYVKEN